MPRKQFAWVIPDSIERRLGANTYGRQRAIFEDGHLLLILHRPPSSEDLERESVVFFRTPDGKWQCNGHDHGEHRLKALLSDYHELAEHHEKTYQDAKTTSALFHLLEKLSPQVRSSKNTANALQSAREYVKEDQFLIGMRDDAYETSRAFELLLTDAKFALDYEIAKNSELGAEKTQKMTEAQHKLNILAAITFPLLATATIFGMNLIHGFENTSPLAFWSVFGAGLFVGLLTKRWVTRETSSE